MKNPLFNNHATEYDDYAQIQRKIASSLLDKIPQSLKPKTILELGTGTGFIGKKLSAIYPESKFTLCDPAPNMLHVAKSKITNKSNFSFMCEELPKSGKFDLIITSMAIQWVADWSSWMSHVHKLLKPSAKLFIATPTTGTLSFLPQAFQEINLDYSGLNYRSTEELINCSSCFDKIHYSKKSFSENFENPIIFFRKLHKIGANVSHKPLTPLHFKRLLKACEKHKRNGILEARYEITFLEATKQ